MQPDLGQSFSRLSFGDDEPGFGAAFAEGEILEVGADLETGGLKRLNLPARGEGGFEFPARDAARTLLAGFGVAEAKENQFAAGLQDRGEAFDVAPAVVVTENVKQAAIDGAVEPLGPRTQRQGVFDQESD